MIQILVGVIFALFDLSMSNGSMQINLIPDFIGCLLIYFGLKQLGGKALPDGGHFAAAKKLALPLTIYAAVIYVLDAAGITLAYPVISVLLGIVYLLILLYILQLLTKGLIEVEYQLNIFMDLAKMTRWWRYMAIFNLIMCGAELLLYLTVASQMALVYSLCSLMAIICEIGYLFRIHAANKVLKAHC